MDANTYSIDRQFLWGACLLISPILDENQTELEYYLPKGRWFDYYTHEEIKQTEGAKRKTPVNEDSMPGLHLRGGCAFMQQDYANNTHFSRQKPLTFVAALDENGAAAGSIFWDDGVSIDTYENGNFYEASLRAGNNSLTLSISHWVLNAGWSSLFFERAKVLGVSLSVTRVYVQGSSQLLPFNQTKQYLEVSLPSLPLTTNVTISWSA